MIQAKIIADSKNEFNNRITTMVITKPRIILSEFNTHRMLSKNSASSRAIPFEKMVKSVEENPFIPIAWQKDHKGMQGTEYFTDSALDHNIIDWLEARDSAVKEAKTLSKRGVTKQLANRLLEPFMYHTVICTATEWENFFALRCPKFIDTWNKEYRSYKDYHIGRGYTNNYKTFPILDQLKLNKGQAEIHMMSLAEAMWDAMNESTPKLLKAGEWHIPFGDNIDYEKLGEATSNYYINEHPEEIVDINKWLIKIATARCARISYTVVGEEDKKDNYENDIKLHDRLKESGHMSPFEHCALAASNTNASGNFTGGWIQYRKMIPNENIK